MALTCYDKELDLHAPPMYTNIAYPLDPLPNRNCPSDAAKVGAGVVKDPVGVIKVPDT
jgi:hypothetical protein